MEKQLPRRGVPVKMYMTGKEEGRRHYEKDIAELKTTVLSRNKELQDINNDKAMLEEQLNKLSNEYKGLANENENLNKIIIQREQVIENIKAKCDQCEIDLKDLNSYNQKIRKERNSLQKNLQVFVEENKAASEHIRIIENDLNEFNNKNQGLKVQIENLEKYNEELQKQIEDFHREKENEKTEDKHYISSLNENIVGQLF